MPSSRAHWRLIVTPPDGGAQNMALDEALMDRARATGEWVLRVYSWRTPTISLGRNQTARGHYDLDRIRRQGVAVVRRPTGGRAILHDHEITYSVTAPVAAAGDLRASYDRINGLLLSALRAIGIRAELAAKSNRATGPGMTPCFDEPAAGELTFEGRKLAGSAQYRENNALLQHGSILIADDQTTLGSLALGAATTIPEPATLAGSLGWTPSVGDLATALGDAVRELEDPDASGLDLEDEVRARASALVVRYLDDAWTWRR
jgi:lipoate-protein ligase A